MGLFDRLGSPGVFGVDEDDDEPFPVQHVRPDPAPARRFRYWVKRAQEHGGNVQGVCTDVRVERSGVLIVLGPEIRRFAPGTWLECNTSRAWEECGGE